MTNPFSMMDYKDGTNDDSLDPTYDFMSSSGHINQSDIRP